MRKLICLITVVLVCVSLVCPALAAEDFVPSISYKGTPDVVTVKDSNGADATGVVLNEEGEVTGYVYEGCMTLTPVANTSDDAQVAPEVKEELDSLYQALTEGTMKLPYSDEVNAEDMVIRDLFDVSWQCSHGHAAELEPEGVTFEMTFDLGVDKDATVVVMTYKNNAWNEIAKVVNNGDGTVTCTFEHFCPVVVSVLNENAGQPDDAGDSIGNSMHLWVALMVVSVAAVVVITATRRKVQ